MAFTKCTCLFFNILNMKFIMFLNYYFCYTINKNIIAFALLYS